MAVRALKSTAVIAFGLLLGSNVVWGANSQGPPSAAAGAAVNERVAALAEAASPTSFLRGAALKDLIESSLKHDNALVRARALAALGIRVLRTGRSDSTGGSDSAVAVARGLRALVDAALRDPDEGVRAMAASTFPLTSAGDDLVLPRHLTLDTIRRLTAAYRDEGEPGVRVRLLNPIALEAKSAGDQEATQANAAITLALADPNPDVAIVAIRGVGVRRMTAALPKLAAFVLAEDLRVRMTAVIALRQFGTDAAQYKAVVERALETERDATARSLMVSAIAAMGK